MQLVNDAAYQAAFSKLNQSQQKAVETIEGPVMVIAGPGTGKTQVLTLRIANILRSTDANPQNILALTFTKSGAKAMRNRLKTFVGSVAYQVPIFTFHGLAERLICDYPEAYETIIGSKPATDLEKIKFIETILESSEAALLRPHGDPTFYIKSILSIISTMKQENVRPDNLAKIIESQEELLGETEQFHTKGAHKGKERSEYTKLATRIEKQKVLLFVYKAYESLMRQNKRYDFDDMIIETVKVLTTREDILLDIQENYQYILADEHQDVNGAQNEILRLLSSFHDQPNIFVVGDEKQAIYRFQGASLENFLFFVEHYQSVTTIALRDNYRSTQDILDAGQSLVWVPEDSELAPYRTPLLSHKKSAHVPKITKYQNESTEDMAVVNQVMTAIESGITPSEIAVIVRSNREVESLTTLLRNHNVAVEPSADTDVLTHPLFLAMFDLMKVVVSPTNNEVLMRVLMMPCFGISIPVLCEVLASVSYQKKLSKVLHELPNQDNFASVHHLIKVIADARADMDIKAPQRVLSSLCTESGLLKYAISSEPIDGAAIIKRIYDEVESMVINGEAATLHEVVSQLDSKILHGVALQSPLQKDISESVQVMTAHKSKGLEFEVVIVPHLNDNKWGGSKKPDYFKVPLLRTVTDEYESLEDERRLLYVAMTRAKAQLYLSYSDQSKDGKELSPSPLLDTQIEPEIAISSPITETDLAVTANTPDIKELVIPLIRKTLTGRGLSVTALNNCIKNPWNFLYRNVLHIPEAQSTSMQFGTAMHSVLEFATRFYTKNGVLPPFTELRNSLEMALGSLPLSSVEFTNLFARGQEILAVYTDHLSSTLLHSTKEELSIKVLLPLPDTEVGEITLTGKLDRVDLNEEGYAVKVVDYKTGKAKTRNDIEGKTAKADASYRRQLSFYSLLLSLYDDERYKTEVGVLSFIEPDAKGRIHEEAYTSGEEERRILVEEIQVVVQLLLKGDFLQDEELLEQSDYALFGKSLLAMSR